MRKIGKNLQTNYARRSTILPRTGTPGNAWSGACFYAPAMFIAGAGKAVRWARRNCCNLSFKTAIDCIKMQKPELFNQKAPILPDFYAKHLTGPFFFAPFRGGF